jgi:hypothetical protein
MSRPATLDKSTTVRSIFAGLQVISPALAAQLAAKAMFRTQRTRVADWERALLESGVELRGAGVRSDRWFCWCTAGTVAAVSWERSWRRS